MMNIHFFFSPEQNKKKEAIVENGRKLGSFSHKEVKEFFFPAIYWVKMMGYQILNKERIGIVHNLG